MALHRFHTSALLVTLILVLSGCFGGTGVATVPVAGSLEYKGAPVADATVTFIPVTGTEAELRTAVAKTNALGEFQLTTVKQNDGAIPGEYLVTVTKFEPQPEVTPSADIAAPPPKVVPPKSLIPEKYGAPGTSGLKATVSEGELNRVELELTD